jgi:crossover junction endodeoxyribonuclease RuvC
MLLGLDLNMNTGWALGKPGAQPSYGSFKLTPCKGDYGQLMTEFGKHIKPMIQPGMIVAYESVILHPRDTLHFKMIACGLACETERLCYDIGAEYTSYYPNQIKSMLSRHGWSTKKQMVAAAKRLGFDPANDHEADAIGVWHCLLGLYDKRHKTTFQSDHLDPLFFNRTAPHETKTRTS